MSLAFELAVQDTRGVRIAKDIGAHRVELTQALALGGLTPSQATLELALEAAGHDGPEIHVLVRPRAGDFHYDEDELSLTARDIERAVALGAHGVVIGALSADGTLDREAVSRLRDAAGDASVTLHRAIDVTPDLNATMEVAIDLGLRRILTSGGASAAADGIEQLSMLVQRAAGRIEIMAGSGVNAQSAAAIAAAGVDAVHFSAKRTVVAAGGVRMGSASDGVGGYETTDREEALAVRTALGL